jgi:hypothetical protein
MRIQTSETVPAELLAAIDQVDSNRCAFVERAVRAYLSRRSNIEREAAISKSSTTIPSG